MTPNELHELLGPWRALLRDKKAAIELTARPARLPERKPLPRPNLDPQLPFDGERDPEV
jgi:hypothetical protein